MPVELGGGEGQGQGGGEGQGDGGNAGQNSGSGGRTYTDADLNRILAEDRRKHQRQAQQSQEAFTQLQTQVNELLNGKSFDEAREEMQQTMERLETAEQKAKRLEEQSANRVKAAEEKASAADKRYQNLAIGRALLDAALPQAVTAATANLIVKELRDRATVNEEGIVTVEMEVIEDGVAVKKQVPPQEAVAKLEENVKEYGVLFKSGVAAGLGGKAEPKRGANGEVDFSKLSMSEFAKLAKERPELVGRSR